ncbi:GIDE domain-containing protein [Jiangella endophytica]|uniref:GIDE domain-containing protein n=1 Tax=Jiangella endophytica TaxID=1623398 RepID=UPI000E34BE57|nr:GIDE domain-containing protein [Jiangella endophytica]
MWLVGLVLLGVAGFCGFLVVRARGRQRQMITTDTFTAQELRTLQAAAAEAAGPGVFRQTCEVAGTAQPSASGALKSEISATECVWHKHVVTRKYWETERKRDSNGNYRNRRVEKKEKVADRESEQPFLVTDETGSVLVHPSRGVEGVEQIVDRFEPHDEKEERTELSIGSFSLSLPKTQREGTIGYQYEEWVLEPGRKVYVLGEAGDASGELAIEAPTLISTKDEETLLRESRSKQRLFLLGATVAAVAGIALIVIGVLR